MASQEKLAQTDAVPSLKLRDGGDPESSLSPTPYGTAMHIGKKKPHPFICLSYAPSGSDAQF